MAKTKSEKIKKTLLLIDREKKTLRLVKSIFGKAFTILQADNEETALDCIMEYLPDIVLIDVGEESFTSLALDLCLGIVSIPTVAMMETESDDMQDFWISNGAVLFLKKPFKKKTAGLYQAVLDFVEGNNAKADADETNELSDDNNMLSESKDTSDENLIVSARENEIETAEDDEFKEDEPAVDNNCEIEQTVIISEDAKHIATETATAADETVVDNNCEIEEAELISEDTEENLVTETVTAEVEAKTDEAAADDSCETENTLTEEAISLEANEMEDTFTEKTEPEAVSEENAVEIEETELISEDTEENLVTETVTAEVEAETDEYAADDSCETESVLTEEA
ncbi:MAG: hypothetical protein E7332_04405, partial [Clostridiales bacterium]|nr:hypothetical protein [Clostridiales bacterium]